MNKACTPGCPVCGTCCQDVVDLTRDGRTDFACPTCDHHWSHDPLEGLIATPEAP